LKYQIDEGKFELAERKELMKFLLDMLSLRRWGFQY
jgi:hypothetical protein